MSAATLDVHYSVERHFAANFSALNLVFEGADRVTSALASWVHVDVISQIGRPSRPVAYSVNIRLSMRICSRSSQRHVRDIANTLEGGLRGGTIDVYDRDNIAGDPIGHISILDPSFQPLPRDGAVHMGVVDAACVLHMDLS